MARQYILQEATLLCLVLQVLHRRSAPCRSPYFSVLIQQLGSSIIQHQ